MTSPTWAQWLTTYQGVTRGGTLNTLHGDQGRWASWLVPVVYLVCGIAFLADVTSTDTLAFGVFYIPLVGTAVFHRDKRAVWVLTAIACVMVLIGAFAPSIDDDLHLLAWNRMLSIGAILATAAFVRHARVVQDQLAEQTSRAEAAERIKTEVLTNLSQEIRAPLYSMIGVLELVAADSRPDQKSALGMVRGAGRRLVTTVDNLVDLTQFEERPMPPETFDLGTLLRRLVEARRLDAQARQIDMTMTTPAPRETLVHVNTWAVRRILENKIADAITYTSPGGRIAVNLVLETDHTVVTIVTSGTWPAMTLQSTNDPDILPMAPTVMGLALSQRLARSIGARLLFASGPGEGTTVHLRLPAMQILAPDGV